MPFLPWLASLWRSAQRAVNRLNLSHRNKLRSPLLLATSRQELVTLMLASGAYPEYPADMRRSAALLYLVAQDHAAAKAQGDWAEELRCALEAQELQAAITYQTWRLALTRDFGEELAAKLVAHHVEVGMSVRHLVAAFGQPAPNRVTTRILANGETVHSLAYGSRRNPSRFEVCRGRIITAAIGAVTFPAEVYALEDIIV